MAQTLIQKSVVKTLKSLLKNLRLTSQTLTQKSEVKLSNPHTHRSKVTGSLDRPRLKEKGAEQCWRGNGSVREARSAPTAQQICL